MRKWDTPSYRATRTMLGPFVAAGLAKCGRCGLPIRAGQKWDLGHVDGTLVIAGPEHSRCNRASSTHRAKRQSKKVSRPWR
jgi:hypothetical protein